MKMFKFSFSFHLRNVMESSPGGQLFKKWKKL